MDCTAFQLIIEIKIDFPIQIAHIDILRWMKTSLKLTQTNTGWWMNISLYQKIQIAWILMRTAYPINLEFLVPIYYVQNVDGIMIQECRSKNLHGR